MFARAGAPSFRSSRPLALVSGGRRSAPLPSSFAALRRPHAPSIRDRLTSGDRQRGRSSRQTNRLALRERPRLWIATCGGACVDLCLRNRGGARWNLAKTLDGSKRALCDPWGSPVEYHQLLYFFSNCLQKAFRDATEATLATIIVHLISLAIYLYNMEMVNPSLVVEWS